MTRISRFCGPIELEVGGGEIRQFCGPILCSADGPIGQAELMAILTVLAEGLVPELT